MILIIDNYDSFSYNLVQVIGTVIKKRNVEETIKDVFIKVVRNDEITIEEIKKLHPSHIILSPGPGRPKDAGICETLIKELYMEYKILGVCLGHQAICETFGATISYAKQLMHGKQSQVSLSKDCKLFEGLDKNQIVARYHSLIATEESIPTTLQIIAMDERKQVMGVRYKGYDVYGLQFHPESVLTPNGAKMIENFLYL
ncbi:MAG: aminodeoxychorismate/anthranilate synthase component II [bacterium]|nr:aminodeoxychorismate/anthranilate synthase component II [bacterium]